MHFLSSVRALISPTGSDYHDKSTTIFLHNLPLWPLFSPLPRGLASCVQVTFDLPELCNFLFACCENTYAIRKNVVRSWASMHTCIIHCIQAQAPALGPYLWYTISMLHWALHYASPDLVLLIWLPSLTSHLSHC